MTDEPNPATETAADDVEALDAEPTPARLELETADVPRENTPDPSPGFYQDNAAIVEGKWAGLPNYGCSACGYSHLDRERAAAHVASHGQTFTQGG